MALSWAETEFPCKPCGLIFPAWRHFWDHKCDMREAGRKDHMSCAFCGDFFEAVGAELLHVQRVFLFSSLIHIPGTVRQGTVQGLVRTMTIVS